ncbi:MAG: hypothetical protein Q7T51_03400 [Candidatus Moranbacteria bacterium]|nr:hypothetical protein [Candidatus Moranbacteria bacterium]
MARWVMLKIWAMIVFSLTMLGLDSSKSQAMQTEFVRMLATMPLRRSEKPDLFLMQGGANDSGNMVLAGHRSHSSHRSHASHSSHYSGSGGGYSTYTPAPSTPPAVKPPPSMDNNAYKSNNSVGSSIDPIVSGSGNSNSIKKVHLKNGAWLPCDSAIVQGDKLVIYQSGSSVSLPLGDVDLDKTMKGTGQ